MSDKIKGVLKAVLEKDQLAWSITFEAGGPKETLRQNKIYRFLGEQRQGKKPKDLPIPDEPVIVDYDRRRQQVAGIEFPSQPAAAAAPASPARFTAQPKAPPVPEAPAPRPERRP